MTPDRKRLERLLGGAANERLRRRLRDRLLNEGDSPVTLTQPTEAERTTVERLLGRPPRRGQTLRVHPAAVSDTLNRAGIATDLRQALEALDGPLHDPAAERAAARARWHAVVDQNHAEAARLGYGSWLTAIAGRGLLKRLARGDPERGHELLTGALTVLSALPGRGINRSTLAARCLGDAHALDRGQPVAAVVRHALKHGRTGNNDSLPDDRSLWAEAGVLIGGDISSTVLTYQLPALGTDPNATALTTLNRAAQPAYLTLRQLLRHPTNWDVHGRTVFVCENPTVVAEAAEHLGTACAPLVATAGRPSAAVLTLLDQLTEGGARLLVRTDLDWAGVGIANSLFARFDAVPWRMDADTLRAYADHPGRPLEDHPVTARWAPTLTAELQARGNALEEEQLLSELLADLNDPRPADPPS